MKLSLKKGLIVSFIVCLLVCAGLIIALPTAAEGNVENFVGVSLSEEGDVCLNYVYSSLGDADGVSVTVRSPEGRVKSSYTLSEKDIDTDEDGKRVVSVRLAAVQMTDTVTVVTTTATGITTTITTTTGPPEAAPPPPASPWPFCSTSAFRSLSWWAVS